MLTRTHPIFSISAKQSEVSIGFLGGGVMAKAMLSGIIASGWNPTTISLTDPKPRNLETLQQHYHGLCVSTDNQLAVKDKDVIILAVKPQVAPTAIPPLVSCLKEEQIVLSVMAGYDLEKLESLLGGHKRTVRVMPNTPSLIGKGATVYCASQACSEKDMEITRSILDTFGICSYVSEASFNAATAVSGCGPAYVFMFIEAMADAGVAKGLPRAVALKLAAQTVMGAGAMVLETGQHPGVLKDNVCSPGGVTIAGVTGLEEAGLRGAVVKGVKCAAARADEMTSRN